MGRPVFLLAALTLWTAPAEELVRWEAPAGCPSQRELTAAIATNLGRPLEARDVAALTATARARRRADARWQLSLTIVPRSGTPVERTAIAEQCSLLAETAALIVAVALDPTLAGLPPPIAPTLRAADEAPLAVDIPDRPTRDPAQSPADRDAPTRADAHPTTAGHLPTRADTHPTTAGHLPTRADAHPPTTGHLPARAAAHPPADRDSPTRADAHPPADRDSPTRADAHPTAARDAPTRADAHPPADRDAPTRAPAQPPVARDALTSPPTRLRMSLTAAAALDLGTLPAPAPGLLARAGLLARRVRAELGVVHWFERPARVEGAAIGGDLRLTAAQLLACPRLALRHVEFPVCAGLELGAMAGEGVGLPVVATDRIPWLAVLAEARALWLPVPRLAVGVHLGLAAPLLAARFRIDGLAGDLHRAAPVAFRGALALELRIF